MRLWDLSVKVERMDAKLDEALAGQGQVDDHEVRIRSLELALAGATARRMQAGWVFNTILTIGLAVISLGVWYR